MKKYLSYGAGVGSEALRLWLLEQGWEFEAVYAPWGYTEFNGEIFAGLCNAPPEMGVIAGITHYGKGKIIFCNFNLVNQLGKNPVADLLFERFVRLGIDK